MNKQELLSQLNNAHRNFMLGIAALGLLMQDESYPVLERLTCVLTDSSFFFVKDRSEVRNQFKNVQFPIKVSTVPLIKIAHLLKNADETQCQNIQGEFFKMLLRAYLKESFEVIKSYCRNTNKINRFRQQSWYNYARIIRNCVSHDFFIRYTKSDRQILPICWNGRSLTIQMDGKPFTPSILSIDGVFELYKEMKLFVESYL